jgi:hypothetical protein
MMTAHNYIRTTDDDMMSSMLSKRAKNEPMATPRLRAVLKLKHTIKHS